MAQADNDLQAALALFNEGLKVQQDAERAQRAIDKAERRKQQAANTLKKVQGNADATGEEKSEAEAAYRAAVDEFNRLRSGEDPPPTDEPPADGDSADVAESEDTSHAAEESGDTDNTGESADTGDTAEAADPSEERPPGDGTPPEEAPADAT